MSSPWIKKRPLVCFDEVPKQLVLEKRAPLPTRRGQRVRYDYEYQRNGVCNLFFSGSPSADGDMWVSDQRCAQDFAREKKWLVDERYPKAEGIRVVLDNLNTHKAGSLYEAFAPSEARRIAKRLEFHYTPKHGSWLNMAEIEISIFSRQCFGGRISDQKRLKQRVSVLERARNEAHAKINWQFTSEDARVKLHHIYPSIPD
ncbi:MAG: transposase (plasmid) [Candidatus Manganitrophus sp.]|nr:transposase [Candidatus Manganitrophus sp.]